MLYERLLLRIAKRWVAGDTLNDAITACKEANKIGMHGIINYLGEHIVEQSIINHTVEQYISVLDKINQLKLDCSISIKPTQIGLAINANECYKNITKVIEYAHSYKRFVWLDMESANYLNKIIDVYLECRKSYDNIGIAIQAYLRDVTVYVAQLLDANAIIRLTKGAYREDSSVIFKSKLLIDKNFLSIMLLLFRSSKNNFAIATHDQKIIELTLHLSQIYKTRFEFQMLRGIRDDLKRILINKGYPVGEYIPYGEKIIQYSIRRIREHPTNLLMLMRSIT